MSQIELSSDPREAGNANLIYILYLIGVAVPIVGIVGLVMAYNARSSASSMLDNHYRNQINIFWKAFAFGAIGIITVFFVIGIFVILFGVVWYIVRSVQGMQALARGEVISDPSSWGFPSAARDEPSGLIT